MHKKLARIGPISLGIFLALLALLAVITVTVLGIFVLPNISIGDGVKIDILDSVVAPYKDLIMTPEGAFNQEGLPQAGIMLGFLLLGCFIVGMIVAILYNIVAAITGGIKVRVEDVFDDI